VTLRNPVFWIFEWLLSTLFDASLLELSRGLSRGSFLFLNPSRVPDGTDIDPSVPECAGMEHPSPLAA